MPMSLHSMTNRHLAVFKNVPTKLIGRMKFLYADSINELVQCTLQERIMHHNFSHGCTNN